MFLMTFMVTLVMTFMNGDVRDEGFVMIYLVNTNLINRYA